MTINETILEKLAEAEIKVWIESDEGVNFIEEKISLSITTFFESDWGETAFTMAVKEKITELIKSKFVKDVRLPDEIFILGMKALIEQSGEYIVEIKQKETK